MWEVAYARKFEQICGESLNREMEDAINRTSLDRQLETIDCQIRRVFLFGNNLNKSISPKIFHGNKISWPFFRIVYLMCISMYKLTEFLLSLNRFSFRKKTQLAIFY